MGRRHGSAASPRATSYGSATRGCACHRPASRKPRTVRAARLPPPLPSSVPALVSAADLRPLLSGLTAEKAELAESLLIPLVNQFGLMQQHRLDRLQQAESERFQAFAAFQSEQFGALREELEQLRELRQEIDEMRSELKPEGRPNVGRDRSGNASVTRPRLGSASAPDARDAAQALAAPEAPCVLRMSIGEAS
jgi:hypothetical protein